ncbi:hypothetical protein RCN31_20415, partial [Escherichia marmotae]|nr:hypothetical protein [Escherichia marmotae]MED9624260.1 hypothetical protein [Escherichia marmotae]
RFKNGPRDVVRYISATCGGFLFPATNATRDKAPQHCASPEPSGLPLILLTLSAPGICLFFTLRDAFQLIFMFAEFSLSALPAI